jgi:hypothetical protein
MLWLRRLSVAGYVVAVVASNSEFAERVHTIRYYLDGTPLLTGDDEYDAAMLRWHALGHDVSMSSSQACWVEIRKRRSRGCGRWNLAVDCRRCCLPITVCGIRQSRTTPMWRGTLVQLVGRGVDGWYDWEPHGPDDLILIDGPQGEGNRDSVLSRLPVMAGSGSVVVIDDAHRAEERRLAHLAAESLNRPVVFYEGCGRGFAIIESGSAT